MKLSKRLNAICNLVNNQNVIADVGSDHGKVVAKLFLDNKINFAYVSDISALSVKKAEDLLVSLNIDKDRYKIIVCDGLKYNDDISSIDLVIIAGMGGYEIIKILSENKIIVKNFILAPNNNEFKLRKYLNKNNYKILCDFVVKDENKFYNIIKVENGKQKLSKLNFYFGKTNFENITQDFKDFLQYEETKTKNIIVKLPKSKIHKCKRYLKLIKKTNKKVERIENDR